MAGKLYFSRWKLGIRDSKVDPQLNFFPQRSTTSRYAWALHAVSRFQPSSRSTCMPRLLCHIEQLRPRIEIQLCVTLHTA